MAKTKELQQGREKHHPAKSARPGSPGPRFDCIIVGAGTAGCTLAKKLAEAGFKVALLEKKAKSQIGLPWEVTLEKSVFSRISLKLLAEKYPVEHPRIARYYASDRKRYVQVGAKDDSGITVLQRTFNQELLSLAIKAGITFKPRHLTSELMVENGVVKGVKGRVLLPLGLNRSYSLTASITIDATGVLGALRRQTPSPFVKKKLRKQDFAFGWQGLYEISPQQMSQIMEKLAIEPGMSYTQLGKYNGYELIHLRSNHTINLISGSSFDEWQKKPDILKLKFSESYKYLGKNIYGGCQLIPIRRAIDSMVDNGFLCIGDSACQVIPTMGSGVASSMHAADIAAQAITDALNSKGYAMADLWSYNLKYQSKRGAILASYDIIRRFLQSLDEKEIDAIFKAGLLTDSNFINTFSSKTINFHILDIIDKIGKIIANPNLLPLGLRFAQALTDSQKALDIYQKYPQEFKPESFIKWQNQTNNLFSHYRTYGVKEKEFFF